MRLTCEWCGHEVIGTFRRMWGGLWKNFCNQRCYDEYHEHQIRRAEKAGMVPRH